MGHSFREAACVDEHKRGAMLANEIGYAIVNLVPHFMRRNRAKFASGNLNRQIEHALVADLHDHRIGTAAAGEKMRNQLDRFLRGREADAHGRPIGKSFEAFERKREMRAAFVVGDGVNFVDDNGFDGFQDFAAFRGGEQNIERFGRGDENMRRPREHLAALVHERVAGAHRGANFRHQETAFGGELQNFAERNLEVFLNVVAESLERRNVKNFEAVSQLTCQRFTDEPVNTREKRSESLTGAGWRGNESCFPGKNMRPALLLRFGGCAQATEKPLANERVGPIERRQCRSRGFCHCRIHGRELGAAAVSRLKLIATGEALEYSLPKAMSSWGVRSRDLKPTACPFLFLRSS